MNFNTSLTKYSRLVLKGIGAGTLSVNKLEELYESLENIFQEEIVKLLNKRGITKIVIAKQNELSNHFPNIESYDFSLSENYLSVRMSSGHVIKAKPGSLRKIIKTEFEVVDSDPIFPLLLGYTAVNCAESLVLLRAIEAEMDEEI